MVSLEVLSLLLGDFLSSLPLELFLALLGAFLLMLEGANLLGGDRLVSLPPRELMEGVSLLNVPSLVVEMELVGVTPNNPGSLDSSHLRLIRL